MQESAGPLRDAGLLEWEHPRPRNHLSPQERSWCSPLFPWPCNESPQRAVVCGILRSSSYRAVPACWTPSRQEQFFPGHGQRLEAREYIREKWQGGCRASHAHKPLWLPEKFLSSSASSKQKICPRYSQRVAERTTWMKGGESTLVRNLALNRQN